MKFKLTDAFLEKFPEAVEYIVVAKGVNIEIPSKEINDALEKETDRIRTKGKKLLKKPEFQQWEAVYEKLARQAGTKAKDFEPSHKSLYKRVLSGNDVPNINNIVNITNLFQLKYATPIGSEDLSGIFGNLRLDVADGGERFRLFGEDKIVNVNEGEVNWVDEHSVTCRMWNWQPSKRTRVTNKSRDIYTVFDGVKSIESLDLDSITKEFAEILENDFGGEVEIIVLDKENPEQEIDYKSRAVDTSIFSDKIVVGKVLQKKKIKGTDDTYITKVDVGDKGKRQIVCGGTNLKKGMLMPIALPGAEVYKKDGGKKTVKESEVRGKKSEGMGCSPLELSVGTDYWHYWVLPEDIEPHLGEPLGNFIDDIPLPFAKDYQLKKKSKKKKKKLMSRKDKSLGLTDPEALTERLSKVVDETLNGDFAKKSSLKVSNEKKFGDFSSAVAMKLASDLKKNPREIASDIVEQLSADDTVRQVFSEVSTAPNGFINFRLSDEFLIKEMQSAVREGEEFGSLDIGNKRTILIESPSINPNAAAHAGHLLNLFIGRGLSRLLRKIGFTVENDNLLNDKGIKICMMMWGVKNLAEGKTPESENIKPDHFIGKYYILGKKAYKQDPKAKEEIQQMLRDWENGEEEVISLWERTMEWAYSGHKATINRLGEEFGHIWLESDIYKKGKRIILEHMDNEIIEELPDGAIVARLEEAYGIPDAVLLRSDGTSLYHTQDIYLTLQKIEKFDPWKAVWIVGNEQIGHFQQLFCLLDELEILSIENLYHFAHGMIVDENGKKIGKEVKSATADGMLDTMHEAALDVINDRGGDDLSEEEKHEIAEKVGVGALRYSFLARDPFRDVTFDPEAALSFTGKSGPYVMYAYTRGRNVMKKVSEEAGADQVDTGQTDTARNDNADNSEYKVDFRRILDTAANDELGLTKIDKEITLQLLNYPEILIQAANNYAPSVLADYLYEVASSFNNFYENESVSGAKGADKELRAAITKLTTTVLKDGLGILGIDVLEKM
jgi:arginyl-tRNA synthetase